MRKILRYIAFILTLVSCQHELHFPVSAPVVIPVPPTEITVAAIVITNPTQTDYDSLVFRYSADKTREVHYVTQKDSVTRTYYYDVAGRLSKLEDERAIYYTSNNMARRINFYYNGSGELEQTTTDFADGGITGVKAFINSQGVSGKHLIVYDTAYKTAAYNLQWTNRIIYSTLNTSSQLMYDSGIFLNTTTAGLYKTMVNEYQYGADSGVTAIYKRIYFNGVLSEHGTVNASGDQPAPAYKALRKKLYRNLANWFDAGLVWQDDNFHIFPLPGGPYRSILYNGIPAGPSPPFTRNYFFENSYATSQLSKSLIDYALSGQGTSRYTTVMRFYYK